MPDDTAERVAVLQIMEVSATIDDRKALGMRAPAGLAQRLIGKADQKV